MAGSIKNGLFVEYCAKDFLDGTHTLDAWEELAYRRIVDMIYDTNDKLADDDRKLAWMTKTGSRWKRIKPALIEAGKIEVLDGRITNPRCRSELEKSARKIAQKSAAGTASAEARKTLKDNETSSTAVATAGQRQTNVTTKLLNQGKEDTGTTVSKETSVPAAGAAPSLFDGMGEGSIRTMPKIGAGSNVTPIRPAVETLEKRVFSRGKEVLGKSAGGMIANLRKKLEFNDEAAMRAIDAAAEKESPREWMSRFIQSGSPSEFGILRRNVPVEDMTHEEFMADLRRRREAMGCIL